MQHTEYKFESGQRVFDSAGRSGTVASRDRGSFGRNLYLVKLDVPFGPDEIDVLYVGEAEIEPAVLIEIPLSLAISQADLIADSLEALLVDNGGVDEETLKEGQRLVAAMLSAISELATAQSLHDERIGR